VNEKLDKIIALLEQLNARLGTGVVQTASTLPPPAQTNAGTGTPQGEEHEFFIVGDARVWKSGKGSFNAAKINHTDGGSLWSLGVPVRLLEQAVGNDWLRKGDVIRARGRVENDLYNGVPRPQMFVDVLELISRRDNNYVPAPTATTTNVQAQRQQQQTTVQNDREEQIPEDNIPF